MNNDISDQPKRHAVWRFSLPLIDVVVLSMPAGAVPLAVGPFRAPPGMRLVPDGPLDLWAMVDPTAARADRIFLVAGTGHPVHPDARYIGTTHSLGGVLIWHVFEDCRTRTAI